MNNNIKLFFWFVFLLTLTLSFSCKRVLNTDYLLEGFINPPDSSKPGVYWYFMDGNIDKNAITADLESMKRAGIGSVIFLEVNVGIPEGNVQFLSDEWQEMFVHAVRECERLGITLTLGSGPGWAGSGGPWVKPSESMLHLVFSDTTLTGPSVFSGKLDIPQPMKPFFGEETLTPELRDRRNEWYKDVRILAFPLPEEDSRIAKWDEKALYYRPPFTSQEGVATQFIQDSVYKTDYSKTVRKEKIIDVTNQLGSDGVFSWLIPPGKWTIMRFGMRNNGAVTRPAPLKGLGFEASKLDTTGFSSHYSEFTGKLLARVKPDPLKDGGWKMIHIDSWEMGSQNWSHTFLDEFIKRRGYDPVLYLPVYAGHTVGDTETSERFLWDVRQTANELVLENHAKWFRETGRKSGMRLSVEPYDMNPSSDIDLGAIADIPMGEFWSEGFGYNSSYSCFEATSAAHITGKQVVAAEAFTADSREAWKNYPGRMKNQTDWALALGINKFFFHTFVHKPHSDDLRPGMTMGPYGVHWDRGQTWWEMSDAYHKYLSRLQYVLTLGFPVADILYLTPEGAPMVFTPPADAVEGSEFLPDKKGFSFDACTPALLIKHASVKDKRIIFPGGNSYRMLVLPDVSTFTPELLKKLESLVKSGATVLGLPPNRSPSLSNFPDCDREVKNLATTLWGKVEGTKAVNSYFYYGGTVYWPDRELAYDSVRINEQQNTGKYPRYQIIESLLKSAGLKYDFISEGNYRYHHRTLPDREIYFVSNRTNSERDDSCFFRNGSAEAEKWDPLTGKTEKIHNYSISQKGTGIKLNLPPYGSCLIVFNKSILKTERDTVIIREKSLVEVISKPVKEWKVNFSTSYGGPGEVIFDTLMGWQLNSDERIKFFSGIAEYTADIELDSEKETKGDKSYYLNINELTGIADVSVNGSNAGIIWCHPWQVEITDLLKKGKNTVSVKVANLWVNRLIGDERYPWNGPENGKWPEWYIEGKSKPEGRYTFTTHRYYAAGDSLIESGLTGPVRIIKMTKTMVK